MKTKRGYVESYDVREWAVTMFTEKGQLVKFFGGLKPTHFG